MLLTGKPKRKDVGNPVGRFIYSKKRGINIMVGIYKITNNINGKIYIGQSVSIKTRWKDHRSRQKWDRQPESHLYNSFKTYGLTNFKFNILEKCEPYELNEREIFYINLYKSNKKEFGYNLNGGGDNNIGEDNGRSILTEEDVIKIRNLRADLKTKDEVYVIYKDKISKACFADVWQGRRWPHIVVDGAYSKKVKIFQQKEGADEGLNVCFQTKRF